jgi:hypothetical protein
MMSFEIDKADLRPNHPRSEDIVMLAARAYELLPERIRILEVGTMSSDDFDSTFIFDQWAAADSGSVLSLARNEACAKRARQLCSDRVEVMAVEPVSYLFALTGREPGQRFDLIWLDDGDVLWLEPHDGALRQLEVLTAALPLMSRPFIVAVDDNKFIQGILTGKARYIDLFMHRIGAEVLVRNYVFAWVVR